MKKIDQLLVTGRIDEVSEGLMNSGVSGCFPAGTPVWTDQGIKPIESIEAGDLVLSRAEAEGETAYKKVVKIFVHNDKTLRSIAYHTQEGKIYVVSTTDNHPFWVVEEEFYDDDNDEEVVNQTVLGWTAAEHLQKFNHLVRLKNGSYARVVQNTLVYRTNVVGHGWYAEQEGSPIGTVIDYVNDEIIANNVPEDQSITWGENPRLKVRVFNIEVEDFHTYYVAGGGVWVHDSTR